MMESMATEKAAKPAQPMHMPCAGTAHGVGRVTSRARTRATHIARTHSIVQALTGKADRHRHWGGREEEEEEGRVASREVARPEHIPLGRSCTPGLPQWRTPR